MFRKGAIAAVAAVFIVSAGLSAGLATVGASGQNQATIPRADAVVAVSTMDQLNAGIEKCMLANGATVAVAGGTRSFTDPGNHAWEACAGPIKAQTDYMAGAEYQAFAADQKARGENFAQCMASAGFGIPGHGGVSGDVEVDTGSAGFQAASIKCSDEAGLIRRNADGTGVAATP